MKKGKVQTNENKVNVLVEHEDGNNRHYHSSDFSVLCKLMTTKEIDEEYSKRIQPATLEDKIDFLKKIKGFAVSHVSNQKNNLNYGQLFKYVKQ